MNSGTVPSRVYRWKLSNKIQLIVLLQLWTKEKRVQGDEIFSQNQKYPKIEETKFKRQVFPTTDRDDK